MLIGKNWKVEADTHNIILSRKRKRVSRDNIPYKVWEIAGYYSSVANALHEMVEQKIRDTELKDFFVIARAVDKLHSTIETLTNLPKHRSKASRST